MEISARWIPERFPAPVELRGFLAIQLQFGVPLRPQRILSLLSIATKTYCLRPAAEVVERLKQTIRQIVRGQAFPPRVMPRAFQAALPGSQAFGRGGWSHGSVPSLPCAHPSSPPARFSICRPASSLRLASAINPQEQKPNLVDVGDSRESLVSRRHHLLRTSAFVPLGCPAMDRAGIFTSAFREQFFQLRLK
jgi:hypothetical protein